MNKQVFKTLTFFLLFFILYQTPVFANSSWRWVTSSPKVLLPFAILLTLGLEIIGMLIFAKMNRVSKKLKIALVIVIANIASFLFPYLYRAIELKNFYFEDWITSWDLAFETGPYYIVLAGYLFLTIGIEVPLVYAYFKKYVQNTRTLLKLIITLNILTTSIIAVMERMMFYGHW